MHRHIYHHHRRAYEPLVFHKSSFDCLDCGKHSADCNCHLHAKNGDKNK